MKVSPLSHRTSGLPKSKVSAEKGLAKANLLLGSFFPLNLLHLISSPGGTSRTLFTPPPFPPLCRNLLWGKDRHAYKWVNWMNRDTVWCVLILTVPSLIMCVFVANMLSLGYNNSEHITHQTVFTFQVYASCFSSNITISRLQFTNVFTLHNICTFFSAATNQRFISSDQFKKVGIAVVMGKRRRKCCGLSSDYPCVYRQKYVSLNHLLQKSIPNAVLCKLYRLLF